MSEFDDIAAIAEEAVMKLLAQMDEQSSVEWDASPYRELMDATVAYIVLLKEIGLLPDVHIQPQQIVVVSTAGIYVNNRLIGPEDE